MHQQILHLEIPQLKTLTIKFLDRHFNYSLYSSLYSLMIIPMFEHYFDMAKGHSTTMVVVTLDLWFGSLTSSKILEEYLALHLIWVT